MLAVLRLREGGLLGGANIFGFALLQPARSVCVSSEHFFHFSFLELLHVSRGTFKVSIQKRIFEDRYSEVLYRPYILPVTQRIVSKTARVIWSMISSIAAVKGESKSSYRYNARPRVSTVQCCHLVNGIIKVTVTLLFAAHPLSNTAIWPVAFEPKVTINDWPPSTDYKMW